MTLRFDEQATGPLIQLPKSLIHLIRVWPLVPVGRRRNFIRTILHLSENKASKASSLVLLHDIHLLFSLANALVFGIVSNSLVRYSQPFLHIHILLHCQDNDFFHIVCYSNCQVNDLRLNSNHHS